MGVPTGGLCEVNHVQQKKYHVLLDMVYKRKRVSRKTTMRKRRRFNISRMVPRRTKVNTLTTKRWASFTAMNGSDVVPQQAAGLFFKLNDLANSAEFTNLFDQYMISGIQYRWCLKLSPDFVTTSANRGLYPYLKWVHDHDDVTINTTTLPNDIVQYPKMKEFIFSADRPCTRWYYLKPAVANSVYGTLVTTAYAPAWRVWCDSAYPGIQHYGIKALADQLYAGQQLFLECRYILKLRGVN